MRSDTSDMDMHAMILVCDTEVSTLSHLYEATEYGAGSSSPFSTCPTSQPPFGARDVCSIGGEGGHIEISSWRDLSSYFSTKRHYCQYHVMRSCSLIECVLDVADRVDHTVRIPPLINYH